MESRLLEGKDRARRPMRNKRHSRLDIQEKDLLGIWSFRRGFGEDKRPPKRLFTPEIKRYLKDWLVRRRDNPYPNRDEKKMLAVQTGLTYIQVCNWFANWRRKLKNAGKEPQKRTWGDLIKTYNSQVQGNVEHFSICSDDSIWEEPDDSYGNNNLEQDYFVSSTSEDLPFGQKFKSSMMEKYLKDCSKPLECESKPSMISKWLESAINFKPNENSFLDWPVKKEKKKNYEGLEGHGREELDAAEALTTLANARKF